MKKISLLLSLALLLSFSGIAQKTSNRKTNQKSAQESTVIKSNNHESRDISPNKNKEYNGRHSHPTQIMAMWDILFNYPVKGMQEAGVETDGNFIYTSDWASAKFYKYSMTGTILDSFSIATVTGIRDLAYDGTYFYGGENAATIYKMDFTSHTLIGTITCPTGTTVRNIAWDPALGGFWVGGWATDIICVNPSGTVLSTIPYASLGLTGMYGSAYDSWTPGGPYLWILDQGSAGDSAIFHQISIATLAPTGVVHNCADISPTAMAGGAFCCRNHSGEVMLGGVAQGQSIFAYELVHSATHCDVGPTQLIYPISSDTLNSSDSIKVQVANLDTLSHVKIPISYVIDGGAPYNDTISDTIHGGSYVNFTFHQPYDFSLSGHVYNVEIYTALACDTVLTNDTLHTTVTNLYDASTVSIDMLPVIGPGSTNPLATVKNSGTIAITFNATMKIGTYTSTKPVSTLAPGASQQITFDPWSATLGSYTIKAYTQLTNDMNHSNDTLTQAITVENLTKVYCFNAYDPTSVLPTGPAYTSLQVPSVITSMADQSTLNFVSGGTWGLGNKWYGSVYSDNTLITLDTVTGARTVIGSIGAAMTEITYDYTSDKLFGVAWDGSESKLYSISTATGAGSLIGTCTTDLLIDLACDNSGNLFAVGTTNSLLYSVNKYTGLATSIGSIGFVAAYAQSMEFDHNTGICYTAAYNNTASQGQLMTVNTSTGLATLIGEFAGGAEITGFAIPYNATVPAKDAAVTVASSPVSACGLGNENITVTIENIGTSSISSFPVSYTINGGSPVTETVTSTITSGSYLNYTFTHQANLSTTGIYAIKVYTSLTGDAVHGNDTLKYSVENVANAVAPYSMGFEPTDDFAGWVIEDVNSDGFTWNVVSTGGHTGPYCAQYTYNSSTTTIAADDWLITKCVSLHTGKTYKVSYWYKVESASFPESFTVNIGNAPTSTAMTTTIISQPNDTNTTYIQGGQSFTVSSNGVYYIGFHCNSAANEWTLYLDDINITDITGITEHPANNTISIYPNPAKNMLNVSSAEKMNTIKLFNTNGEIVMNMTINNTSAIINTSALAEGVYYLRIETAKGITSKNVIIQK
ncbi:MAG: CARDB domain-containing protein [Bacteroidales bacterium]|jgi:hypothetical protein